MLNLKTDCNVKTQNKQTEIGLLELASLFVYNLWSDQSLDVNLTEYISKYLHIHAYFS